MRLVLLVVFSLQIIFNLAQVTDDENACMNKEFTPNDHDAIAYKFSKEYSIITDTPPRLLWLAKTDVSQAEKGNMRQLCVCVIFKTAEKDEEAEHYDMDDFHKVLDVAEAASGYIKFPIGYYFFSFSHKFSSISCNLDGLKYIVAKGAKNQSKSKRRVYNLYIGAIGQDGKLKFEGVIENVDVEMPVYGNIYSYTTTEEDK